MKRHWLPSETYIPFTPNWGIGQTTGRLLQDFRCFDVGNGLTDAIPDEKTDDKSKPVCYDLIVMEIHRTNHTRPMDNHTHRIQLTTTHKKLQSDF